MYICAKASIAEVTSIFRVTGPTLYAGARLGASQPKHTILKHSY
jgi:hypothetical protein